MSYLYPIQRFVIANILEGKSQIVVLPTGAGKSLCFQLPARALEGLTLVVVPLVSLLEDQLEKCRRFCLPAEAVRGGQSASERARILEKARLGIVRLLYTTPEALLLERVREAFRQLPIAHLVVDEAHCIYEWGPSFRPAYRELGQVTAELGVQVLSAFTATAGPPALEAIRATLFQDREPALVQGEADRPNIRYRFLPVLSKSRALESLVRGASRPVLVFSRSRPAAEAAARTLRRRLSSEEVFFYHAGLSPEERRRIEAWFSGSTGGMLTATSAYGMGVDKPDIRTVIHFEVPYSVEAYLQESGRAGRDGRPTEAVLLYSMDDVLFARQLESELERRRYRLFLERVLEPGRCRRESLLSCLGLSAAVCSGCDVCQGQAMAEPDRLREILSFFRRHNHQFGLRRAVQILNGRMTFEVNREELDAVREYGMLGSWEREDVEEALKVLLQAGLLRIPARGPWKNRLRVTNGRQLWEPEMIEESYRHRAGTWLRDRVSTRRSRKA